MSDAHTTTTTVDSPLLTMTRTTPTALWNDSADPAELSTAIGWGAVGATCNPVIALAAIRADQPRWEARIREIAAELPTASESEIGWKVVEEVSLEAAELLAPVFAEHGGRNGRLSMQTDPRLRRSATALADQAEYFASLAPNIIVKVPATSVGVEAIEDATYRGVNINVTVSFSVPQALATGEAIERGLRRREAEGLPVEGIGPVVTIMVGRLDDWLKEVVERDGLDVDPAHLEWAGVAAVKRAYTLFRERGLRARVLAAAYRNQLQWTELVGGDLVLSPPFAWQQKFQDSGIDPQPRIDVPVDPEIIASLERIEDFRRAYEPDGMTPEEFDDFGATRKTLRQFLGADEELDQLVRDVITPAP
ncbi:transaldolase family protein [Phycicoccus sonneratiae]|uniref:Transaldolase family protein n=1 Tax=Phycicoccus sonneratiae TaxID=2807628 RepID=A0ABS2CRV0_9MICO|nr:transaldolase family protein [Phycicoccus sonneraticus]MBM6402604.1 transaldolase family protein [Phycicoccus sonneraticus]